jgi:integrase
MSHEEVEPMLTDKKVKDLAPGSYRVADRQPGDDPAKAVSGFGVRVLPSGVKSFYLDYRVGGVGRRPAIASWPNWTVVQARAEARKWRVLIDQGTDPQADRIAEREAKTVRQLAERYVEEVMPKNAPGTRHGYMGMLNGWILPQLGGRKVKSLRPADVEQLHAKITRSGAKTRANHAVGLLSAMLSAAVRWEVVERNVARGAVARNPQTKRRRYLSPTEIARLSAALADCGSQSAADAVRLVLLTGARKTEVAGMRWAEVDLSTGVWARPAPRLKQRADHDVPLGAAALEILARRRASAAKGGEFVFPAPRRGGHLDIRATWATVRRAAGLGDVRLHDLRHSFASILVSSGASLPLIGALLGHSNPATTARYAHLFLDPQRAAVDRVGAIVTGTDGAEVVPIAGARR